MRKTNPRRPRRYYSAGPRAAMMAARKDSSSRSITMIPQPPPGQGPVDPRGAFGQPPAPGPGFAPTPLHATQQQTGGPGLPPSGYYPAPPPGYMPPPPMMMPPPFYPPPPPAPRRSFGGAILTTLATTIFGLSLAMNVYLLLASGAMSAGGTKQDAVQAGDPQQQVAVYPLRG